MVPSPPVIRGGMHSWTIRSYFGARDATYFSDDAVVLDEGHTHRGREAIAAWIAKTTAAYRPSYRLITELDPSRVEVEVSGTFPGSPIRLHFAFTLRGEQISRLEIA